jgi:hypothetical protein
MFLSYLISYTTSQSEPVVNGGIGIVSHLMVDHVYNGISIFYYEGRSDSSLTYDLSSAVLESSVV